MASSTAWQNILILAELILIILLFIAPLTLIYSPSTYTPLLVRTYAQQPGSTYALFPVQLGVLAIWTCVWVLTSAPILYYNSPWLEVAYAWMKRRWQAYNISQEEDHEHQRVFMGGVCDDDDDDDKQQPDTPASSMRKRKGAIKNSDVKTIRRETRRIAETPKLPSSPFWTYIQLFFIIIKTLMLVMIAVVTLMHSNAIEKIIEVLLYPKTNNNSQSSANDVRLLQQCTSILYTSFTSAILALLLMWIEQMTIFYRLGAIAQQNGK